MRRPYVKPPEVIPFHFIHLRACGICGSGKLDFPKEFIAPRNVQLAPHVIPTPKHITWTQCRECGVWMQNPRLDDDSLGLYYSSGLYRQNYQDNGGKLERKRAERIATMVTKRIGKVKNHLDIGCSRGYLLTRVNAELKATIEPFPSMIEALNVVKYRNISEIDIKFDLVTMLHLLEHVPYPIIYLQLARDLLSDGGKMVIEVPQSHYGHFTQGGAFAHIWQYNPDVIKLMMRMAGLKIVYSDIVEDITIILERM